MDFYVFMCQTNTKNAVDIFAFQQYGFGLTDVLNIFERYEKGSILFYL
jgi:hypothetical protein